MIKNFIALSIFLIALINGCNSAKFSNKINAPVLMDEKYLANTKTKLIQKDTLLLPAFTQLIAEAEAALLVDPFSVTYKNQLPPSGNKHDYASYSRYWWPNLKTVDGLPYIRKDGETNPASQSLKMSDRPRIGSFGLNTETLALAYYFTGEKKYAQKAAALLRVWFLDETTLMNPNMNHSQIRLGHNKGTKSGVLDGRLLISALEGSLLIANSGELSNAEMKKLKHWAAQYFNWLTTNEMALKEAASKNNHGNYYDVQAIYFAMYAGKIEAATKIAKQFISKRIYSQIEQDGSMPEEMARTRPLFYSIYNLHAMILIANLAKQLDVNVWQEIDNHSRLQAALDFLVPYTNPEKQWPQPTIGETDRMKMYIILQMADRVFPNQNYLNAAEKLPLIQRKMQRTNLALPLIR